MVTQISGSAVAVGAAVGATVGAAVGTAVGALVCVDTIGAGVATVTAAALGVTFTLHFKTVFFLPSLYVADITELPALTALNVTAAFFPLFLLVIFTNLVLLDFHVTLAFFCLFLMLTVALWPSLSLTLFLLRTGFFAASAEIPVIDVTARAAVSIPAITFPAIFFIVLFFIFIFLSIK